MCNIWEMTSKGIVESSSDEMKKKPGVWLLIGKENKKSNYICLQVAQTINIGKEMRTDIEYLSKEEPKPDEKVSYINQFGEKQFEYDEYRSWRARNLYHQIAINYVDLSVVCMANNIEFDDKENREKVEKYIAYITESKYWVNGGPFRTDKPEIEIKNLKEAYKEECDKLVECVEQILGKDKFKCVNLFLEKIMNGTLCDDDLRC